MNAKKCKQLRRMAEHQTVGMPNWEYASKRVAYGPRKAKRYGRTSTICAINAPHTTRGVYRAMKRAAQS